MVLSGFKTNAEMFGDAWGLPSTLRWDNYATAINQGVLDYFVKSAVVTVLSIVGVVFLRRRRR